MCYQAGTSYLLINGQLLDVASLDFFKVPSLERHIVSSASARQTCAHLRISVCTLSVQIDSPCVMGSRSFALLWRQ